MAVGGMGDVLTGIIVSLLGRGLSPLQSSLLGTFLHGLCGDLAVKVRGEESLIAGDLISFIPDAIKNIKGSFNKNLIEWIVEI